MFERLLVATDLSATAYAVVDCLAGLKAFGARELLLLECLSLNEINALRLDFAMSAVEHNLQKQRELLEKQGFVVETRCVDGVPGQVVDQAAEAGDYSLIVVGSYRRSLVGEVFLGGLDYEIIHNSRRPVFLVRLQDDPQAGITCIQPRDCDFGRHILFPTDFSANAGQAFTYVKDLVRTGARQVTVMHVQDQFRIDPYLIDQLAEFNRIDEERLAMLQAELQDLGDVQVETSLAYGSPAVEIIHAVREKDISLVVMGSQGRGFVRELFLGSVSHNVARHAMSAVLLIPAAR